MAKKIYKIIKKIIFAGFILYAYNIIMAPLDLIIPINFFTLGLTAIFGVLAIPFFALLLMIVF